MTALTGRRVLVIGASSGIGAAVARSVVEAGGDVTVSARRGDALEQLVADLGAGHAVAGDATDPTDARRVAAAATDAMGGIDLLLYAAGYGVLQRIEETDPDVWTDLFRVNVIGANLCTGAVLPHMGADGICAYLSSSAVEYSNALFASYSATKAALEQCIRSWRVEHPDRRFVRVVMGNCQPTDFANQMGGGDLLGEALDAWAAQAIPGGLMHVDEVGSALVHTLAVALDHPGIDTSEIRFNARP
jgi:NAD(P)-dependent dehydrogenase (short-subunit alcohol dehydrogenase family)